MKKFKLIKEYPNSPKLGTIITSIEEGGVVYNMVHQYPEFWKEMQYEILSFKAKLTNEICNLEDNGEYRCSEGFGGTLEQMLSSKETNLIHSVRRLSDNQVFTIGDYIKAYPADKRFKIGYIWINGYDEIVLSDYLKDGKSTRRCHLSLDYIINLTEIERIVRETIHEVYLSGYPINPVNITIDIA